MCECVSNRNSSTISTPYSLQLILSGIFLVLQYLLPSWSMWEQPCACMSERQRCSPIAKILLPLPLQWFLGWIVNIHLRLMTGEIPTSKSLSLSFVLVNDTWSQKGHSVTCITMCDTSFNACKITRSDIRPYIHVKWAVSLVITDDDFNFHQLVWVYVG